MKPSEFEQLQEQAEKEGYERGYSQAIKDAANIVALQNGPDRGKLIIETIMKIRALSKEIDEPGEPDPCPECGAPSVGGDHGSGVKCSKCDYWFCY